MAVYAGLRKPESLAKGGPQFPRSLIRLGFVAAAGAGQDHNQLLLTLSRCVNFNSQNAQRRPRWLEVQGRWEPAHLCGKNQAAISRGKESRGGKRREADKYSKEEKNKKRDCYASKSLTLPEKNKPVIQILAEATLGLVKFPEVVSQALPTPL